MSATHHHREAEPEASGLLRAAGIVRERWWVPVITLVVCVFVALVLILRATPEYTATAKLQFGQNALASSVGGTTTTSADPQADQATNLLLVTTTQVAQAVKKSLGLTMSVPALLSEVSTSIDQSSNIVAVSATDPSPTRAARLADAFADQFVATSKARNVQQVLAGEQLINQQLQALPATPANAATRASLQAALQRLVVLGAVQTGDADVIDYSSVPTTPSSPNKKVNLIVAAVFGLALGIGLTFLLNLVDRRVKDVEDFEELYGSRALATIPWQRHPVTVDPAALEQFLMLRNELSMLMPGREPRVVLVTSAVSGEGKTTVAVGLARAAAASGQTVVLVETDFKRPALTARLGILDGDSSGGLSTALRAGVDPTSLLEAPLHDLPQLLVLTSGPHPPNSYALLSSREMGRLLEQLAAYADLVVLDAPPLLPVADAQALLDQSELDAYLVVGRMNFTKRDDARNTRKRVERRSRVSGGLVINGVHEIAGGNVYYAPDVRGRVRSPVGEQHAATPVRSPVDQEQAPTAVSAGPGTDRTADRR